MKKNLLIIGNLIFGFYSGALSAMVCPAPETVKKMIEAKSETLTDIFLYEARYLPTLNKDTSIEFASVYFYKNLHLIDCGYNISSERKPYHLTARIGNFNIYPLPPISNWTNQSNLNCGLFNGKVNGIYSRQFTIIPNDISDNAK